MSVSQRRPGIITVGLVVLLSAGSAWGAEDRVPVDMCSQRVAVTGVPQEQLRDVKVEVCRLYNDSRWAISARWDDNGPEPNLRMARLMHDHGYKGNFYWHAASTDWAVLAKTAQTICKLGHAIGSHSLTHPALTVLSRNRINEEIMLSRVIIESETDRPVNSYAFPYSNFLMHYDGGLADPIDFNEPMVSDIYRIFRRSGYVHCTDLGFRRDYMKGFFNTRLLPPDGAPLKDAFDQYLQDEVTRRREPSISFSMHAWAFDCPPASWEELEKQFRGYSGRQGLWYCNQSEYGAYRLQHEFARIEGYDRSQRLSFTLVRPTPLDSNDPVPLTLKLTGADLSNARVTIDGAAAEAEHQTDGSVLLNVAPPDHMPRKIDAVYSSEGEGRSVDFPFIKASLTYDQRKGLLRLRLNNAGNSDLTDVRVTYRLPLDFAPGVERRTAPSIGAGTRFEEALRARRLDNSRKALEGYTLMVAQVDFSVRGIPNRLYCVYRKQLEHQDRDDVYPKGRFSALGPFSAADFEKTDLLSNVLAVQNSNSTYLLPDGRKLVWLTSRQDDEGYYDPEQVVVLCKVDVNNRFFIVSNLISPVARKAKIIFFDAQTPTDKVWLNGVQVKSLAEVVTLNAGDNRLVIYKQSPWPQCFVRVVSAETGERLSDIAYSPLREGLGSLEVEERVSGK